MDIRIYNDKNIKGPFAPELPADKALSHRALIAAFLAGGGCTLANVAENDDVAATRAALKALAGCGYTPAVPADCGPADCGYTPAVPVDRGGSAPRIVDCGESAATLRLLMPLFVLSGRRTVFTGKGRLLKRPLGVYEKLFDIVPVDGGIAVSGTLKPGRFDVPGNVSSQLVSGLLLALPLLDGDSQIVVQPPFESSAYVDLTLQMLSVAGVHAHIEKAAWNGHDHPAPEGQALSVPGTAAVNTIPGAAAVITVPGTQKYRPFDYTVPADWSAAASLAALAFLTGKDIDLSSADPRSAHPDRAITAILEELRKGPVTVDISGSPDLGPLLFAAAARTEGTSVFTGASRLRIKESDRIQCMQEELAKLGCTMRAIPSGKPGSPAAPPINFGYPAEPPSENVIIEGLPRIEGGVTLSSHADHRIAIALSVLACCAEKPVIIEDAECVSKSWPGFFEALRSCGVSAEELG